MTNNVRKLVYVPILHAREDSSQAAAVLRGNDAGSARPPAIAPGATVGARDNPGSAAQALPRPGGFAEASRQQSAFVPTSKESGLRQDKADSLHHSAIGEMWSGIAAKIAELNLPWCQTRIYQDGLPVCGKELEVVARLAEQGSDNHRLILDLLKQGAQLEGTENMDFLMREYDLLNVLLMKQAGVEKSAALAEYQAQSRALLSQRDAFITQRLKNTLRADEVPLVFMGVMHCLDKMLEKDFLVSCVIYRLPFRSLGAIYNV